MEKKSKSQIRTILVLFLFGMALIAMGLGFVRTEGFNLYGTLGLGLACVGVLLVVLGIRELKKPFGFNPEY